MELGNILVAALGIGLLIFVHELGHFLAARAIGVRVEVFSLGFGPRLCGRVIGGTDFRLSLVPFGGFVMVAGQDPGDDRYPRHERLYTKSVLQRAMFWGGGVAMNVLFAVLAFPVVYGIGIDVTAPVVGSVDPGSPAWEAGLEPGDRIAQVGSKPTREFQSMAIDIALNGGKPLPLLLRAPNGTERTVQVEPRYLEGPGQYSIGIGPAATDSAPGLVVAPDSAAAAAGLRTGDLLLAIDGIVAHGASVHAAMAPLREADERTITFRVRNTEGETDVRVTPRPLPEKAPARIGVTRLPRVVRGIRQDAAFVQALGLRRDDRILAIDGAPFLDGDLAVAKRGSGPLRLLVGRGDTSIALERAASADERAAFVAAVALGVDELPLLLPKPDWPAALAGIRAGDLVESLNGVPVRTFADMPDLVAKNGDQPLRLVLRRAPAGAMPTTGRPDLEFPERVELTVTPRTSPFYTTGIDVQLTELREPMRADGIGAACSLGATASLDWIKRIYLTLKRMVTGDVGTKNLGGIIRISQVSYQASKRGWMGLLYLLAMLSMNLAFVNLLPIPVLDGGHLLFVLIEAVKGSPVNARVFGYSQVVGLVFVLMLVLFVTYNDILQLL